MNLQKFKAPKFTGRGGFKNNDHSAASGWLFRVIDAVRVGTAPAIKAARTMAYHGVLPKMEDDLNKPLEARVSSAPLEPQDVPDATDGIVRKISTTPFPPAYGMKNPNAR